MEEPFIEYGSFLSEIPSRVGDEELLTILRTKNINWQYINAIRNLTGMSDEVLSTWLNVTVRTLRSYRKHKSGTTELLKDHFKEHVLLLLSLMKHGISVFGSRDKFDAWLGTENFFFDNKSPSSFLTTITGIRFVDDRLTAMEFGDNV